ncbi:hypothetical protein [Marinilabilia salmonicolor]|uniref:Uncharacterized protein n=1 Tax=Marinilabilia salmonicolor TaxID=989 RepID=A0A368ULD9_9BACT|nr:hypothetical protein [Marinilabilia salmonicolor]RCW29566.1 hypothetical protein DFO77_12760 [Marinilabilia salmonicolor]
MDYSIAPDGMISGVIDTVSQEQINEIMGGDFLSDKESSILFSQVAISLQKSIKKCVPEGWNIDFVTRDMIFQENQFFRLSKVEKEMKLIENVLELIEFHADRWFTRVSKELSRDEVFLKIYTIESNIQEEKIKIKFFKKDELTMLLLDFITDILILLKKKIKIMNFEELVNDSKKEPKHLFDIWLLNAEYIERVKKWDEVMNYLAEREFLRINGQELYWEYAEGKKRNPFLAALLLKFKKKNYINIEDRKGGMYMNILKRTFNVKLSTPADYSHNSIKEWNNSKELALYDNMP